MAQILADIQNPVSFLCGIEEKAKRRPIILSQHLQSTNRVVSGLLKAAVSPVIRERRALSDAVEATLITKRDYDRAWFVRLGYECVAEDGLKASHALTSPEFSYAADVILDDIADEGEARFGKPCLHRAIGSDAAMYVAEMLRSLGTTQLLRALEENRTPPQVSHDILRRNQETIFQVNYGQFLDVVTAGGDARGFSDDDYLELVNLTTGVDIANCLTMGAMLGGCSASLVAPLSKAGSLIGTLMQVRDDLLDYALLPAQIDKTPGRDLAKLRMRLPYLVACRLADQGAADQLRTVVLQKGNCDWETVRGLILTPSTTAYVRNLAGVLFGNLAELLDAMEIRTETKAMLKLFADTVLFLG